jgi:hypothetical protein
MTNQELRQLCEDTIAPSIMTSNQEHLLATECLRLLAENAAMRGVRDAARFVVIWPHYCEGEGITELKDALAQLPPEVGNDLQP